VPPIYRRSRRTLTPCLDNYVSRYALTILTFEQKGNTKLFSNTTVLFQQLSQPHFQKQIRDGTKLTFVDLGSGDGRVVFRAAAENLFVKSTGYELNPLLHLLASGRRWVGGPRQWELTTFYCSDLWNVDLRRANVVTVVRPAPPWRPHHRTETEWV